MTWLETFWCDLSATFPIIYSVEAGRYVVTAGLVSAIIWAFWDAHFKPRKIQARVADVAKRARLAEPHEAANA